jgi:hypothetical protein
MTNKKKQQLQDVGARIDLLQASQFIANSWCGVSTETIQNCSAYCGFKHINLDMLNKADSENLHHIGNSEEF